LEKVALNLDEHRIAIRERSFLDLLDLGLRVLREYAAPLAAWLAVGVLPAAALNAWLLSDFPSQVDGSEMAQYLFLMTLLVVYEAPLALAPATLFLGQALFTERPRWQGILRQWLGSLPQIVLYQGLLRIFFLFRPYVNEIILLERNPVRRRGTFGKSTYARCRALHAGEGGELFSRWFISLAVATLVLISLWGSLLATRAMLLSSLEGGAGETIGQFFQGELEIDLSIVAVWYPLVLWTVAGYFAVVRFLAYVDLRIRREGWEVELVMRAERDRLMRRTA
jgi:hypothetical protein